jgi:hypothetical protein
LLMGEAERRQRRTSSPAYRPRAGRSGQSLSFKTFLQRTRPDRFFALWVLEATSGMRCWELAGARRDLLDLDAGTLAIETTRVVVDGRVIESGAAAGGDSGEAARTGATSPVATLTSADGRGRSRRACVVFPISARLAASRARHCAFLGHVVGAGSWSSPAVSLSGQ